MKTSQFNLSFKYGNDFVWYNSLANDYIIMNSFLNDLFIAAEKESVDDLQVIHPDFYNHLLDKNFIVDESVNEVEEVKKLVKKIDIDDDSVYSLIINPTMNCNFKCWYCYENHIKKSKMSKDTLQNIISLVENILQNKSLKKLTLSWFGGEPLLQYQDVVLPLLKEVKSLIGIHKKEFTSNFTSNGLLINEKMLLELKSLNVVHFQITLDGHRERHNKVRYISEKKGSYDKIVDNIKLALKHDFRVTVRLNLSEETFDDETYNLINDFSNLNSNERKNLIFSFHKVWQEEKPLDFDISNLINHFEANKFNITKITDLDTVRDSCYADKKNQATINYNGDVFKCTARDFSSESKEGVLEKNGTINWNNKYYERLNSKFKNPPCLKCRILPICNGGCSQNAIENADEEYCVYDFDENKKLDKVKDRFFYAISDN